MKPAYRRASAVGIVCVTAAAAFMPLVSIFAADEGMMRVVCPPDLSVRCNRADDLDTTGRATAAGDCGGVQVSYVDSLVLPSGRGDTLLLRTWTAADTCGRRQSCMQTIRLVTARPRIAVLPLENLATAEEGSRVMTRLLEAAVARAPQLELIEPGVTDAGLLRARIRQPYLMDHEQQERLAAALDAQYLLVGSVLNYEISEDPYLGRVPIVACVLQLIRMPEATIVWSDTFHAVGSDGEWLFGLGVDHDISHLGKRLAGKALHGLLPHAQPVCPFLPR